MTDGDALRTSFRVVSTRRERYTRKMDDAYRAVPSVLHRRALLTRLVSLRPALLSGNCQLTIVCYSILVTVVVAILALVVLVSAAPRPGLYYYFVQRAKCQVCAFSESLRNPRSRRRDALVFTSWHRNQVQRKTVSNRNILKIRRAMLTSVWPQSRLDASEICERSILYAVFVLYLIMFRRAILNSMNIINGPGVLVIH